MADNNYRETLRITGVPSFLWTQFLGAFNDNVSKIIVTFIVMGEIGKVQGTTLVAAIFILPFLLFSGYSGYLADRFSKRRVLVAVKVLEIGIMLLSIPGLLGHRVPLLLAVMFLMGTHSTFFSPSKYGIVPELVPASLISAANGLLEMSTFAAIVLGTSIGGALFVHWQDTPLHLSLVLVAIALTGLACSLGIPKVPPAKASARLSVNPFAEVWRGAVRVWPDRTLRATMFGDTYFWFLGALLQAALLPFGQDVLHVGEDAATQLYAALAIGIAAGSLSAGRLSGHHIELGLVPVGSIGLGIFSLGLARSSTYAGAVVALALLGFSGGFFAVPLNALLQHRPADDEKGRIQATKNFAETLGILLASGLLYALNSIVGLTIPQIFVVAGIFTLLSNFYILAKLPDFFIRFTLWLLTHTVYRIRIVGRPNIPSRGPALLVANHVSMIDGALVAACIQRFVRFMVYAPIYRKPLFHAVLKRMSAIPISASNRKEMIEAIGRARAELQAGHVVCIFAEGAVSRTGNMLPFKRGFERIVAGLDVPIVPIYLDRVWGSVFSFKHEKFIWKMPERLPYPVTVTWGQPMPSTSTAVQVRQAVTELGAEAIANRRGPDERLHLELVRSARRHWRHFAIADTTGQRLTYGRALIGAFALSRAIARRTAGEQAIGILLPASAGAAITNIAAYFANRLPINLNFTIGPDALTAAIDQARITTIFTSRKFLAKAGLEERPGMVFLEDLRGAISTTDKLVAIAHARLTPRALLRRWFGGARTGASPLATIIFSSGSTGVPKGVMLTHANLLANIDSIAQIFPVNTSDVFIGVLPHFHSFGFTGTFWFPLLMGAGVAYHTNPMDAKVIGELAETYKATMLISTSTFCQTYVRRITKEQFATLKYAIVGAEKLRPQVAADFREKYGLDLLEGYGMTEMAPVVAVNRPNFVDDHDEQIGTKPGSVGHPIPGVAAKVVDRDTGEDLGTDREGLLLLKGPNMMVGYLDQPERTSDVIRDGWYVTGDIARIDEDGFIFITDRLSRFSKIGGEMVPHVKVEDAINEILGDALSAVTAIPDETKGERLVAFYARPDLAPEQLWEKLSSTDLPKLWLPRRDCLFQIEAIPTLGTGKVDLKRVKEMAKEKVGSEVPGF